MIYVNITIAARRKAKRRKIISPTTNPIRIPLFSQAKQQQKMIIPRFSSISRKALQCECLSHSDSIQSSSVSPSLSPRCALCFRFLPIEAKLNKEKNVYIVTVHTFLLLINTRVFLFFIIISSSSRPPRVMGEGWAWGSLFGCLQ